MITSMPARLGRRCAILGHPIRRAVRRDDAAFVRHAELASSISAACRIVSQSDLLPMMTPTRGCAAVCGVRRNVVGHQPLLLTLRQGEAGLAVERAEIFGLDDLDTRAVDAPKQRQDLACVTTPLAAGSGSGTVGTRSRLRRSVRPDLYAAVRRSSSASSPPPLALTISVPSALGSPVGHSTNTSTPTSDAFFGRSA